MTNFKESILLFKLTEGPNRIKHHHEMYIVSKFNFCLVSVYCSGSKGARVFNKHA